VPADVLSAAAKRKKAAEDADEFNMGSDEDARLFKSKKRKPSNAPPKPRAPAKPKAAPKALTAKQKNQEKESQRNSAGNAAMARALAGMGSDDRRYEENEETRERRNEVTSSSSAHRDRELMAKKAARGDYAMQGVSGDQGRKQSSNSSMGEFCLFPNHLALFTDLSQFRSQAFRILLSRRKYDMHPPLRWVEY
jgi:hypothetical protein